MSFPERLNDLYAELLRQYHPNGISNTSTAKFEGFKQSVAAELGLAVSDVYATGATARMSNFDTRLAQGNNRNQHTPIALAFYKDALSGRDLNAVIERAKSSFLATASKFVNGAERGTTFDAVLLLADINEDNQLRPLKLIVAEGSSLKQQLIAAIPGLDVTEVQRVGTASNAAQPNLAGLAAAPVAIAQLDSELIAAFQQELQAVGLIYTDALIARYLAALLAKRFVLLAGLSGSGKTQLALAFAKWLAETDGQVEIVAVGADWTSNENILGYRDALDPSKYRRPSNGALDVILRAAQNTSKPYFLILDEMNLSHVERYFSDMLSAIESGEQISLHSSDGDIDGIPPQVRLPSNLFIVGTVNVDETAYTFSPKVLDRANVIEFRVQESDLLSFLDSPRAPTPNSLLGLGQQYGEAFVTDAASRDTDLDGVPASIANGAQCRADLKASLIAAFQLLSPLEAEFGYRTAMEISRFVFFHATITGPGWQFSDALDAQVLQKLLPKIHGSERRLRPLIEGLRVYADSRGLQLSAQKLLRIEERLRDGYASFLH